MTTQARQSISLSPASGTRTACFLWERDSRKARLIDDLGSGDGCTFYVGARANGKMFRGYEKGRQLGDAQSNWFRVEVEFRAKDRLIPLDVLTDPTPYLAGS